MHYMKGYFFLKCVETQVLGGADVEMVTVINEFVTKYAEGAYITVFSLHSSPYFHSIITYLVHLQLLIIH